MEEKINEYFLKAIFTEKDVPVSNTSLTKKLTEMMKYATPELHADEKNEYKVSYIVDYNTIKEKIKTEEEAYNLRTHGWVLSDDEKNISLTL